MRLFKNTTLFNKPKYKHFKAMFTTSNIETEIRKYNNKITIEEAITPPSSWYTNREFFDLECKNVFKNNWVGLQSNHSLLNPGSYISGQYINEPYVIVKNAENKINAFYNVCSHHASVIAKGCGSCNELVCPYHGWTYNLEGQLTKTTSMKGIKKFKPKEHGLKPILSKNFGDIIFMHFNSKKENQENVLKEFEETILPVQNCLKEHNFDDSFSELAFVRSHESHIKCNWKVFVDNYCDGGYHVPFAHLELNSSIDLKQYKNNLNGKCSIQTVTGSEKKDKRIGNAAVYAYIYPNIMLNRYGPWLDINVILPLNENECIVLIEWFVDKSYIYDKDFINKSIQESIKVQEEDELLCNNVMRGLKSDAYDTGRYVPGKEAPAYHFHQLLFHDLIK